MTGKTRDPPAAAKKRAADIRSSGIKPGLQTDAVIDVIGPWKIATNQTKTEPSTDFLAAATGMQ